MGRMNIRDPDGVVHAMLDHRNTVCFTFIEEGWTTVSDAWTCIGCLARTPETFDFAYRVATRVSWQAYTRCLKEILNSVTLRKGDTVDYRHTFDIDCVVVVSDDGDVTIMDSK